MSYIRSLKEYIVSKRTSIGKKRGSYFLKKKFLSRFHHFDATLPFEDEKKYKSRWEGLLLRPNPIYYRVCCRVSGKKSLDYVPEDIYRKVILENLNGKMLPDYYPWTQHPRCNTISQGLITR